MKPNPFVFAAGALALLPALACADASIEMRSTTDREDTLLMRVKDNRTRWDSLGDSRGSMLFDGATRTLTIINHQDKSYMQLDKAKVKGMSDQMSAMMEKMEAQLANLPPEQREMLKQRMPAMNRDKKTTVYSAEKAAGGDTVNGFRCDNVRLLKDGQPHTMACVASAKALGISAVDYDTLAAMFEAMKDMASQFSGEDAMMPLRELGGLPVRSKSVDSGEVSEVVSVNDDRLDSNLFDVPDNYSPQQMPQF